MADEVQNSDVQQALAIGMAATTRAAWGHLQNPSAASTTSASRIRASPSTGSFFRGIINVTDRAR